MGFDEITVKSNKVREIAKEVKTLSTDTPYHRNDLGDYLYGNGGNAHSGLFDVNSNTDICVDVTRQLIECTSRFLTNAADTFEENDNAIAKEVSKS